MSRLVRSAALAAAATAFLASPPLPPGAPAQTAAEPVLIESERRLEQIRRERLELREEMSRMRSRVGGLATELENLDRQLGSAAGVVEELEFQLARREEQIERNREDLRITREHLAVRREVLHSRLREIYKRGPMQTAQVLLAAESFSDLLNRYRYLFLIARHDRLLAEDVALLEAQLVARERALGTSLAQLDRVRRETDAEQEFLATLQDQQQSALSSIRPARDVAAVGIEALEREEGRLRDLIEVLELRGSTDAPTITPAARGQLEWPVEGPIAYALGAASRAGTATLPARGVGVSGPAGASVRAVAAGSVVLAGVFEAFGPTLVLSHGGGYYTLYLFLDELRVRQGDRIEPGQSIGTVGGSGDRAFVEFQLREAGGTPVDPLLWLRRR